MMKKKINSRKDIEQLVDTFYEKVNKDERLGFIFNDVAGVHWDSHLKTMYSFWENIILFTGDYAGNPMNLHQHIHHLRPLNESDFDRWNQLFIETIDELFEGSNAELAKERAISISNVMRVKIVADRDEQDKIY